jgi:hypothetical protein
MSTKPQEFPLRTLQDIYNLPSYEHMERCFDELKTLMLQARATNDMFVELAGLLGEPLPEGRAVAWPEVIDWTDDGKGQMDIDYVGPDGEIALSMHTRKSSSQNK